MFGYTLQDHERDSLIAPCHRWVERLSDDERRALSAEIWDAFDMWQQRQADHEGRVKVVSGGTGLLSLPMTATLVPRGDVEPWQCAGPFVMNDIDLAFKLWLDDDPDFAAVLGSHRLWEVFAIIGLWSARTAAPHSLIRLNGMLVKTLVDEVKFLVADASEAWKLVTHVSGKINADKQRALANLDNARKEAQRERKRKADELHQSLRTAAFDYWCAHPLATKDKVVAFLREHGFDCLAVTTIERKIANVLAEVRMKLESSPAPRADLYATGQKRNGLLLNRPQK